MVLQLRELGTLVLLAFGPPPLGPKVLGIGSLTVCDGG